MKQKLKSSYPRGIHGITHIYRVLCHVKAICRLEQIDPESQKILEFCAVFHDLGRVNDGIDHVHGQASIKKLEQNNFFGLIQYDQEIIRYIIENHCIDDKEGFSNIAIYSVTDKEKALYLYKAFKDADNLDRVRIDHLNLSFLRMPHSPSLEGYAWELLNENFSEEFCFEEIWGWISDEKKFFES